MPSVKVAMICPQIPPAYGGAGAQVLALSSELARRSVSVEVLTTNEGLAARRERRNDVQIFRMPGERLLRTLPARFAAMARTVAFAVWLSWKLTQGRYDVLHVHGAYWYAFPALLASFFRRTPLIVKITLLGADDGETLRQKRLGFVRYGRLSTLPLRCASAVVTVNGEIARQQNRLFPHVPVLCIPNGVNVARFRFQESARARARLRLSIDVDSPTAVFVGALTARKGALQVLEAWPAVTASHPLLQTAHLILAGPRTGYRGIASEADALAVRLERSGENVHRLTHVRWEDMPELLAAADVFILLTEAEGMPNALLEALAAGLRIVVTDVAGVRELVSASPGANILVPRREVPLVVDALAESLMMRSGSRASRVPERFTVERVAESYVSVYDLLVRPMGCQRDMQTLFDAVVPRW